MRRIAFWIFTLVVLAGFAAPNQLIAAFETATSLRPAPVELLVFEHPDCQYCQVFRRDVLPRYRESTSASQTPIRYIDLARTDTTGLNLRASIHVVPTFVLMQNGREVDRIVGYWAPDNFFKMLSTLLAQTGAADAP